MVEVLLGVDETTGFKVAGGASLLRKVLPPLRFFVALAFLTSKFFDSSAFLSSSFVAAYSCWYSSRTLSTLLLSTELKASLRFCVISALSDSYMCF